MATAAFSKATTPTIVMSIAAAYAAMLALAVVYVATSQSWLGLRLERDPIASAVRLTSTAAGGPAQRAPLGPVTRIRSASGEALSIKADDLVEEPDYFDTYDELARFFDRQTALHSILKDGPVQIEIESGGERHWSEPIEPDRRPVADLPTSFWVQIVVGVGSFLIGGWVWSLRRTDPGARLFALTGVTIPLFTLPAALYSTRELALDGGMVRALSALNHGGALAFGAAMIALFLTYPVRIVPARMLLVLPLVVVPFFVADALWRLPGPGIIHLAVLAEMVLIMAAVLLQYWWARHDPVARAVLRWLGLTVVVGAGSFILTVAVPSLLGLAPALPQGYAFAFFLLIYAGLALGVSRYRLFELDAWAFRILFYAVGAALLLGLDALLIYAVSLDRAPAFGVALLLVALLYLPMRDTLHRLIVGRAVDPGALFQVTVDVALSPPGADQNGRWAALLKQAFNPLRIEVGAGPDAPQRPMICNDGLSLVLPGIGEIRPVTLAYAHAGRKLFSRDDQKLARELCMMLDHAIRSRQARDDGVAEERARISRDMHDNIGAKLLSALHSTGEARKNAMISDALSDFRIIINNAFGTARPLDETLAELRIETTERLEAAGIGLEWETADESDTTLPPAIARTLCSIIREAVSNVIRHAGAKTVSIAVACRGGNVSVAIADDGRGIGDGNDGRGNGLASIRARTDALGGSFEIGKADPGTRLSVLFPC